jgi:uncharacterized protein
MRSRLFMDAIDAYDSGELDVALRLMETCAEQGDPVACFMAALWHKDGDGVSMDLGRCEYWLERMEKLASQGNAEAQWELGQNYRFGNLFPLDIARANYLLENAAEGGSGEAQHHLAWYLESGQYGYPIDPELAEQWYQRAFNQGHPETLYLFALRAFQNGKPTEIAIELLKRAANKGFKQASDMLSISMH